MQWSYSGDVVLTTDASRALQLLDIRYIRQCCFRRSLLLLRRRGSRQYTATKSVALIVPSLPPPLLTLY